MCETTIHYGEFGLNNLRGEMLIAPRDGELVLVDAGGVSSALI